MYLAGFDGAMDFSYQFAHGNIYDDTDSLNWDYVYAYPTVDGVLDTLQWEAWREAADDVRYLTTLLDMIEHGKAEGGASAALALAAESLVTNLRSSVDAEAYYDPGDNWYDLDPRINFAGRDMQLIRWQMAQFTIALQESIGKTMLFRDTFEDFTAGTTVSGQGQWFAVVNAANVTVNNQPGIAQQGQKYLDFHGSGTLPARLIDTELGALSELSYSFRMGDLYGGAGAGDAFVRFWWTGGAYPPGTFISTEVFDTGALCYYDPATGQSVNTGELLADDAWYEFSYVYNRATGEIQWVVTDASDESVVLDITLGTYDTALGENWSYSAQWQCGTDLPGAGFHVYLDNLSLGNVLLPPYLPGDANGDGMVTDADYTIWADTFGSTIDMRADWNGDNQITDADFTLWADNYGYGTGGAAAPEPATIGLLAVGLLAVLKKR